MKQCLGSHGSAGMTWLRWALWPACLMGLASVAAAQTAVQNGSQRLEEAVERLEAAAAAAQAGAEQALRLELRLEGAWLHHPITVPIGSVGRTLREDALLVCRVIHAFRDGGANAATSPAHAAAHTGVLGAELGSLSSRLSQQWQILDVDASALAWDGARLQGVLSARVAAGNPAVDYGEGENMHSMLKARRTTLGDWHIGGASRVSGGRVTIQLDAARMGGSQRLDLWLDNLAGSTREASLSDADNQQTGRVRDVNERMPVQRRPLRFSATSANAAFGTAEGFTPGWNRAIHHVDATGLHLDADAQRLHGELRIRLHADPWVVPQPDAAVITVRVDARLRGSEVVGRYNGSSQAGPLEGGVHGELVDLVSGVYRIDGVDGPRDGPVKGIIRRHSPPPTDPDPPEADPSASEPRPARRPDPSAPPDRDEPATSDTGGLQPAFGPVQLPPSKPELAAARAAYVRAMALDLRLRALASGRPSDRPALRDLPEVLVDVPEAAEHYIAALADFAQSAATAPCAASSAPSAPPRFAPNGPATLLRADQPLPADPGQRDAWLLLADWQLLGPLVFAGRQPQDLGSLPVIVPAPVPGLRYATPMQRLDKQHWLITAWREGAPDGRIAPVEPDASAVWTHTARLGSYGRYDHATTYTALQNSQRSLLWYAQRELHTGTAGTAWLAVKCHEHGRIWLNRRLVWSGAGGLAVVPVQLIAGRNELLLEAGHRGISYHPPPPWEQSRAQVWLWPAEQPQVSPPPPTRPGNSAVHGYLAGSIRHSPDAAPPVAMSLSDRRTLRWRTGLTGTGSPPVIHQDRVYITDGAHLLCLDRASGKRHWSIELPAWRPSRTGLIVRDDGLWAVAADGAAVCISLEGRQLWHTPGAGDVANAGLADSPLIVDGLLILHDRIKPSRESRRRRESLVRLRALDAGTGESRWSADLPPQREEYGGPYGGGDSAILLERQNHRKAVVICADGTLLDAADGQTILPAWFDLPGAITPLVDGDTAMLVGRNLGQAGMRLWLDDDGTLRWERTWAHRRQGTSSPQRTAPGMVMNGLLCLPRGADEDGGHHPVPWSQLDVYRASDGQRLARPCPVSQISPLPHPIVRAGPYAVFSDWYQPGRGAGEPAASISFVEVSDRPRIAATIEFEDRILDAAPVFADRAVVLRFTNELVCIEGLTGDDAAREEALALAATAIAQIGPEPPAAHDAREPGSPDPQWFAPGFPRIELRAAASLGQWSLAGPLREQTADPQTPPPQAFSPLPPDVLVGGPLVIETRSEGSFYRPSTIIDLRRLLDDQGNATVWLAAVLHVPVRISGRIDAPRAAVHLGGQLLPEGAIVDLLPGEHALLLRIDVGPLPPVGRPILAAYFREQLSTAHQRGQWLTAIRERQAVLQDAARHTQTGVGRRAGALLNALNAPTPR